VTHNSTTDDPTAGLRIRQAVRAVVLDPEDRVLLVRFEFPDTGSKWALPGGGLEPDESDHEAIRRELDEEVGAPADSEIGPHIWSRLHIISLFDGSYDGQRERIYLVRTPAFEPAPGLSWEQLNAECVFEVRWWRLEELHEARPHAPVALIGHLTALLRDGPPNEPVDVGV